MARFIEELTEKIRARNIAKGRAIGCAKERVEWNSWADRKEAAETKGEPFDEPRPGGDDAEGHIEGESEQKMSEESMQQPTPKVWSHNNGQAEFILQPVSESLVRVTHRDQVGYIEIDQNWDVAAPYSWTFRDRTARPGDVGMQRFAKPDGIHRNPFGEPTPEAALKVLCNILLDMQRKEDSKRINPEERKQSARKVLGEFLDELPDFGGRCALTCSSMAKCSQGAQSMQGGHRCRSQNTLIRRRKS